MQLCAETAQPLVDLSHGQEDSIIRAPDLQRGDEKLDFADTGRVQFVNDPEYAVIKGDWTFVTRNFVDFRGAASRPGGKGQYARVDLHAGLICLNGPEGMTRDRQLELFEQALRELEADPDLVNQVLEVTLEDDDHLRVVRYALPAEGE